MIPESKPVKQKEGPLKGVKVLLIGNMFGYPETLGLFLRHGFESQGATIGGLCTRTAKQWGETLFKPDYAIFIKTETRPELPVEMKEVYVGCKTILYFPDMLEDYTNYESHIGHKRNNEEHLKAVRPRYDQLFLACWEPDSKLKELDAKWLPVGFDPQIDFPVASTCPSDVLFIGTCKSSRMFIPQLKPQPTVYGNGWNEFYNTSDIYNDSKRDLVSGAKINLNEHYLEGGPNHRDFSTLACGGFLLNDWCTGSLHMDFPGACMGGYRHGDAADCQATITHFLEHPELREYYAKAGLAAVQKHSYANRVLEMLKHV